MGILQLAKQQLKWTYRIRNLYFSGWVIFFVYRSVVFILFLFQNNLLEGNQGGLSIRSDSSSSATSLKGYIRNNLFVNNTNLPALYIEGRQSSPYQEVTLTRNYFTRNVSPYVNNIILKQVVSSFTHNYVKRNIGFKNVEISGFDRVRLPIFQTTSHNGFYK